MIFIPAIIFAFGSMMLWSRYRTLRHPCFFIILWWCFWMTVAILNPLDIDTPSTETWGLFLVMIASFAVGSFLPNPTARLTEYDADETISRWHHLIFWPYALVAFPVLAYFVWKSRAIIAGLPAGVNRSMLMNVKDGESILTGTTMIRSLLEVFIAGPALYFSFFIVAYFARDKKWFLPVATILFTVMYQGMELGRFQIYRLAITMLVATLFIWPFLERGKRFRLTFWGAVGLISLVLIMGAFSAERTERRPTQAWSDSVVEFISYHTVGFTLFDIARSDRSSPLHHELGLGRAMFAGAGVLVNTSLQAYMGPPFRYRYLDYNGVPQDVGIRYADGQTATYNSYYTLLYPLYLDGRFPFVLIIPALLGYLCSYFFLLWRQSGDDIDLAIFLFFTVNMIMSLFESTTERTYTFVALAFLILAKFASMRIKLKQAKEDLIST